MKTTSQLVISAALLLSGMPDARAIGIASLIALDDSGSEVRQFFWTNDSDPLYQWQPDAGGVQGYSFAFAVDPDCSIDTTETSHQASGLDDGPARFAVRAIDNADNCGPVRSLIIGIDATAETITGLAAFDNAGGNAIADGDWTNDRSPYFSWSEAASAGPLAGYSYALNANPDCTINDVFPNAQLNLLVDGSHSFRVRALDVAGNCGPIAEISFGIDGNPDGITGLVGRLSPGGSAILEAGWIADNTPYMSWNQPFGLSPIVGYSHAVSEPPDCTVDLLETTLQLPTLNDGAQVFRVRAVDAAGNCGFIADFDLNIDTAPDAITGLEARDDAGTPLPQAAYQSDADPLFVWSVAPGSAPILGYSLSTTSMPDCISETQAAQRQLSDLIDGQYLFRVRAMDAAGNCGAVAAFEYWVDSDSRPVDLRVSMAATESRWIEGGPAGLVVTVENLGPADANTGVVTDDLTAILSVCSWTCSAEGAAGCGAPTGNGPIEDAVTLPAGDRVSYGLVCEVVASEPLAVSAAAGSADWEPDANPSDNTVALRVPTFLFAAGFE